MQVMVELSMYPLVNDYIGPIKAFIERLNSYSNLTVITCSTSTQVHGDYTEDSGPVRLGQLADSG